MQLNQAWIFPFACLFVLGFSQNVGVAQLLPSPDDVPEEVLQTQVIDQAKSQMDGTEQHPSNYAREQQRHRVAPENVPPKIAPEVKQLVDLLRIRKLLKSLIPFL